MLGYIDSDERLDEVLRKANRISVRETTENVRGSECFVIDAHTKYGQYTVWLDPEHGYHPAKVRRKAREGEYTHRHIIPRGSIATGYLEVLQFEKVDDIWVPLEVNAGYHRTIGSPKYYMGEDKHYKRTQIILNPDHDQLGSFDDPILENPDNDPELRNGTLVEINFLPTRYTWQDGQVVDEKGQVIIDCRPKKASGSAESKPKSAVRKRPSAWELLRKYATQQAEVTGPRSKERVVYFPTDRSLGRLMIQDQSTERIIETFHYWGTREDTDWDYLGQATGKVTIPAGKRLALYVSQDGWRDLSPLSNLKPDDLYMLTIYGQYTGGQLPDDRCMPHIAHLTGLKSLNLGATNISDSGIKFTKDFKSLERLFLPQAITNKGLAQVAQLQSLKALQFYENHVTNAGLAHLGRLTSLEELQLVGGRIGDAGPAHLAKLPSLRYLMLAGKNFTDAGLAHLRGIRSLRILDIGGLGQVTDTGLLHLSYVSNLESLNLHWNENITDTGIAHLKKLHLLKKLDITHSQVTDKGVIHLSGIKSLEYLSLPFRGITDQGLAKLRTLQRLRFLSVGTTTGSPITNAGLEHIANLKSLEHLSIGGQGITDAGIVHIARLSSLKELALTTGPLNKGQLTGAGLASLTALKSLQTLFLHQTHMVLSDLTQLSRLPELTNLEVKQIRRGNFVLDISGLTKLRNLDLSLSRRPADAFGDADLACLAKLRHLKSLDIYPHEFSDTGIAHLSSLTEMERLGIGGPELTDDALRHLANMTKLNQLTISDGNITEQGLRHLERLKALTYLNITSRHRISAAAKRRLQDQLPNLAFFQTQLKQASPPRRNRGN